ncbi:unnamed protein product [Staurois parvus]|uniref:Uncharacterized protein n=1 Tax=Staurois parvus TaxID=386267 RepID=A0ABN9H780_9NEOB|nr:unnamed protein product [Staurois parvus]
MAEWSNGRRYRDPGHTVGPAAAMRSRYGGPWQITCLAAAMGGP